MKNKINRVRSSAISKVGVFASSLLVTTTAVYIYSPIIQSHASESDGSPLTQSVDVSLSVKKVLSFAVSEGDMELDASNAGFTSESMEAYVKTNSLYGYSISFSDVDNDSSLVSSSTSMVVSSSFDGQKTSSTLEDNTWGFSVDGTNYKKVPTRSNPQLIVESSSPVKNLVTVPVHFGVKVGERLPGGDYVDDVIFSAYTNGVDGIENYNPNPAGTGNETGTISQIARMQNMTSEVCAASETFETGSLMDNRDGMVYTVAKLDDGKCWMSQNLTLGGKDPITLTPSDSDVATNWVLPRISDATSTATNTPAYFVGKTAVYGKYYNYFAATAGTEYDTDDGNSTNYSSSSHEAEHSICPKGWRLPTSSEGTALNTAMGLHSQASLMASPYNYVYSSHATGGRFVESDYLYWWTSTLPNGNGSPRKVINSNTSNTYLRIIDSLSGNQAEYSIRCIAR